MKIGIAGIGGIGSNVAVLLVRYGIFKLKLVDHDRVDASNLNRQFYFADQIGLYKTDMLFANLKRTAPHVCIETITTKITADNADFIFEDCDIVVEGLDDPNEKKQLIESLSDSRTEIVSACGIAGEDMRSIGIQKLNKCHIVGDFNTPLENHTLYPPKIVMIASKMTDIVISLARRKMQHSNPNKEY